MEEGGVCEKTVCLEEVGVDASGIWALEWVFGVSSSGEVSVVSSVSGEVCRGDGESVEVELSEQCSRCQTHPLWFGTIESASDASVRTLPVPPPRHGDGRRQGARHL